MQRFFLLLPVIFLLTMQPAQAKKIPVNIKADLLRYSEDQQLVTATGSVEIEIENIFIKADKLILNTSNNVVTAEGNVIISGLEYDASGSGLTYRVSDEVSVFNDFKTVQSPANVKGQLFIAGERITDLKKRIAAINGEITTCDQKKPHYLAMARKVVYFPNEGLHGYFVTLYQNWVIKKTPVMWFPYIYYDLKNRRRKNWTFGENEVEGRFIKTTWDSPYPRAGSLLFVDWMEKKSIGAGTEIPYGEKSSVYLYGIREKDTQRHSRVVKINHNKSIGKKTKLSLQHNSSKIYTIPSGRNDQFHNSINWDHQGEHQVNIKLSQLDNRMSSLEKYNLGFKHKHGQTTTSYTNILEQSGGNNRYIRNSQEINYSTPFFFSNTDFKTRFKYNNNIASLGSVGDERLESNYSINHRNKFFKLSLASNHYVDVDGANYSGDSGYQYLEKQPELSLTPASLNLKVFKLSSNFSYGWYHEVKQIPQLGNNRDFAANRMIAEISASRSIPLILGNRLSLKAGIKQHDYSPGDRMYKYNESVGLTSNWFTRINNKINFNRNKSEGNSPFFFDKLNSNSSNLTEALKLYYKNSFCWTINAGYNFLTKNKHNYQTELKITPTKTFSFKARSGYDPNNKKYLDLTTGLGISPIKGMTLEASVNQDINIGAVKTASSKVEWEIGDKDSWRSHLHLSLEITYNPTSLTTKVQNMKLVKDLHCWILTVQHSAYRKETSFTLTIKAFPNEPFGWDPAKAGSGFFYEGVTNAINN
ncbi:LptA/OstA family protein [Candidatus Margulisiibacteriota bacterium]